MSACSGTSTDGASLSRTGYGDINIGESIGAIRAAHPDFPNVAVTDIVTVTWQDCNYGFTKGFLSSITPNSGGRTADGVGPGTPLSRATELYGAPLDISVNSSGTTLTYAANQAQGTAYRMGVRDYSTSGSNANGTVTNVGLCRCLPHGKWDEPVVVVTTDSIGAATVGMSASEVERAAGVSLAEMGDGEYVFNTTRQPAYAQIWAHPYFGSLGIGPVDGQIQTVVTDEGYRLGEDAEAFLKIYGTRAKPVQYSGGEHPGHYYVVTGLHGSLVAALDYADGNKIAMLCVGRDGTNVNAWC
ncbi:hypothetical protein FOS14_15230 [Skermania sp. ID1734]|uniref:hypothetical protein n=1 Tax=Skermania sp. ID1734 TaxID=2597516 RepID=UPI0011803E24|nr:hypothetical protein [Skermania sp. ID1734]TSD97328.1 hypothetical protein FOS14_15230 [Skermania sp. ID1734]